MIKKIKSLNKISENDKKQLTPMTEQIEELKKELEINDKTNIVADSGYFSEREIINNLSKDDYTIVVSPDAENKKSKNEMNKYTQEDFSYDSEEDIYICPEGKELKKSPKKAFLDKNKREVFSYKCKPQTCNNCSEKEKCTKGKNGRKLLVSANREKMQKYIDSLKDSSNKKIIKKRKELVEHPFGTIKRCFGYTYFLLKGIEKVKAEFSFISFIVTIQRS